MSESNRKHTAISTEYGKYKFLHVPFGIHIAQSYFAMMVSESLKALDICFVYLDDIIIYSKNEKEHLDNIRQVFNC